MMMMAVAAVLVLVLASSDASKFLQPFHHIYREKDPYPSDPAASNEGESAGMLAKLAARLRSSSGEDDWEAVPDPRMYVLTELESPGGYLNSIQDGFQDDFRPKRKGPSLSIVNPLEVLQEKWRLQLNRRQKEKNREILSNIGKRSVAQAQPPESPESHTRTGTGNQHEQEQFADRQPQRHASPYLYPTET